MYFIRDRINQILVVKKLFVYGKNTKVVCKEY